MLRCTREVLIILHNPIVQPSRLIKLDAEPFRPVRVLLQKWYSLVVSNELQRSAVVRIVAEYKHPAANVLWRKSVEPILFFFRVVLLVHPNFVGRSVPANPAANRNLLHLRSALEA